MRNKEPTFYYLQEAHHPGKDKYKHKVKWWGKIFQENGVQKQSEVVVFITDKADFTPKLIRRDKECLFIRINETIYQEDIKIVTYVHRMPVYAIL
jgi:hypothetical protein